MLDLGCGTGELGRFKPTGAEVHGIEIDPAIVESASAHEIVQTWDLDDLAPLPFPDASFDAVVAKDILEHLQRPWQTVAEMRRVVRPCGVAVASVVSYRAFRTWSDYTHVRGFTMRSAHAMFSDAGWDVVHVWRMGGIPLTARLNLIRLVPPLLGFPPFDWLWTSSYELLARPAKL